MNIKTSEVIHTLLIENSKKAEADYKNARCLQHVYEESETPNKGLIESQTAAADELREVYLAADHALEDFESHEW